MMIGLCPGIGRLGIRSISLGAKRKIRIKMGIWQVVPDLEAIL